MSRSNDEKSHGGKLYYLYAKNAKEYLQKSERDAHPRPTGLIDNDALQVVVKETWEVRRTNDPPEGFNGFSRSNPKVVDTSRSVERDGMYYVPSKQSDLFIMIQFDKERPGTDDGWVYGTVSPDGKLVTGSGRVQNCMNCHLSAPRHRLFGLGHSQKPKDSKAP